MFQCQRLSSVSCRISSRLSQGAPSEIQKHDSLLADLLAGLPSDGICRRPCSSDGRTDHEFAVVGSDDDLVIHPGLWDGPSMPSPKLSPLIVLLVKVGGPGTWWPHGAWSSWCLTADLPTYKARLAPASKSPQKGEDDVMPDHEISWRGGNRGVLVASSLVRTGRSKQKETFSLSNSQKLVRNGTYCVWLLLLPVPLTRISSACC